MNMRTITLALLSLLATACGDNIAPGDTPDCGIDRSVCAGRECGDNGRGVSCGACSRSLVCLPTGRCGSGVDTATDQAVDAGVDASETGTCPELVK